jgi:hypothetical protein
MMINEWGMLQVSIGGASGDSLAFNVKRTHGVVV